MSSSRSLRLGPDTSLLTRYFLRIDAPNFATHQFCSAIGLDNLGIIPWPTLKHSRYGTGAPRATAFARPNSKSKPSSNFLTRQTQTQSPKFNRCTPKRTGAEPTSPDSALPPNLLRKAHALPHCATRTAQATVLAVVDSQPPTFSGQHNYLTVRALSRSLLPICKPSPDCLPPHDLAHCRPRRITAATNYFLSSGRFAVCRFRFLWLLEKNLKVVPLQVSVQLRVQKGEVSRIVAASVRFPLSSRGYAKSCFDHESLSPAARRGPPSAKGQLSRPCLKG